MLVAVQIDDVVIYGGGVHTSQLLNNTVDLTHRVKCIIDTNKSMV